MTKRHVHHFWRTFCAISPWYFLVLTLVSGAVCVVALRGNNQHMVKLRTTVYQTDQDGGDVVKTLNSLRLYVYAHMNTNLSNGSDSVYPPIQLKYTYDRLVKAESDRVAAANSQVYTDAQHYCEAQDPVDFSGHNRVPCIESYVGAHGTKPMQIPDGLYKFDFVSPTWSPDLAGWSLLVTIASGVTFIFVLIAQRWFKQSTT